MLDESPIPVVIGGVTYLCPQMPFYCLERAWPHIQKLSRLGAANQVLAAAQLQVRNAVGAEDHQRATENLATALMMIEQEGADYVGQTRVALSIIVAALALDTPPPSYDSLSKLMRGDEIGGIHAAVTALMETSGLVRSADPAGEAVATPMPPRLNGAGSSPN
jgi:hypothetical protein